MNLALVRKNCQNLVGALQEREMRCNNKPSRTAGGKLVYPYRDRRSLSDNDDERRWEWEKVTWFKCRTCGLNHSNRYIPGEFWNRKWYVDGNYREKVGVILLRDRRDIFITESYHKNCYGFPKGERSLHETREECAKREFLEETGSDALENMNLSGCRTVSAQIRDIVYIFYIVPVKRDFNIDTKPIDDVEITSFGWKKVYEVDNMRLSKAIRLAFNQFLEIFRYNPPRILFPVNNSIPLWRRDAYSKVPPPGFPPIAKIPSLGRLSSLSKAAAKLGDKFIL